MKLLWLPNLEKQTFTPTFYENTNNISCYLQLQHEYEYSTVQKCLSILNYCKFLVIAILLVGVYLLYCPQMKLVLGMP